MGVTDYYLGWSSKCRSQKQRRSATNCTLLDVKSSSSIQHEGHGMKSVFKKIFNYVEMLMVFESLCVFTKRMYSLKVFCERQLCNLFFGISRFTVFWWPQSPWVVRLATRDGWSRRFRRGGGLSRHGGPPSCQGPTLPSKGIWDPIKYPRHIQSRELICKTC